VKIPVPLCDRHRKEEARAKPGIDPEPLPEDGIVDFIAVEIAAKGWRHVRLTKRERALAAALIMTNARENAGEIIMERLNVSRVTALRLVRLAKQGGNAPELSARDGENLDKGE
jgi:hypothetical protein